MLADKSTKIHFGGRYSSLVTLPDPATVLHMSPVDEMSRRNKKDKIKLKKTKHEQAVR